ncbi:MAG: TVP38/TMEM64 family protein [Alphaproteobacteria bacterium]|nr:MAG: TVP38/TMEM64 family protein [Alphaproteobacteria bacterium]
MTHAPESPQRAARRRWVRFIPGLALVSGFVLFFVLGFDRYLSLSTLSAHREALVAFTRENFLLALCLYAVAYSIMVAFSLPGGAVMTIAGGFLFGTVIAGSVIVVAATLGATVVFWAARTAFSEILRDRAGPWLTRIREGFSENGASYLLVLRLVPLFPFFVVNIAPAFLNVSTRTYVLTTFFGIIPGTFVYASVGNGVGALLDAGKTPDLGIVFEAEILLPILGLAALALVPVVYRKISRKGKQE